MELALNPSPDQFRGPSVSKRVIIPALPNTRVLWGHPEMGEHPNHTEIRLTEVRASVEILVDPAVAPG